MNPKLTFAFKVVAAVFIVALVAILLSANKIVSSAVLILTAVLLFLPIESASLKRGRVIFTAVIFIMVIWNISTTDYPRDYYNTGVKFFDQSLHIFDAFLQKVLNTRLEYIFPSRFK